MGRQAYARQANRHGQQNEPPCDGYAVWGDQLKVDGTNTLETWETQAPVDAKPPPSQISKGERISVYWTELGEWYAGTFTSSRAWSPATEAVRSGHPAWYMMPSAPGPSARRQT